MSEINWQEIECAIIDWAEGKFSDLDRTQFFFEDQNLSQPPYPYLTFKRDSLVRVSGKDEIRVSTDLTQPAGKEIALETIGIREFTLTVNAWVDDESGGQDPNCNAMFMMSVLQLSLSQLSTQEIFCLAGISVVEELAVVNLSQVVNTAFVSRAAMDVRMRVAFSCIERTGYIDTVEISSVPCDPPSPSDVTGVDLTVTGS